MKIYTKTGDDGTTSLFGGKRVWKDNHRVKCYGEVDELNSVLGIALGFLYSQKLKNDLESIQNKLFNIGSYLATPKEKWEKLKNISSLEDSDVEFLENRIDEYDAQLPELKNFILPSGSKGATFLHLARSVCRRLEREIVTLIRDKEIDEVYLRFFNRLSDYLFVAARFENYYTGNNEKIWKK